MKNEFKELEFSLYAIDKNGKWVILKKREKLEIKWNKTLGLGRKEIFFEKDGKKYKILAEVELRRWFLRDKVIYSKTSSLSDHLSYCSEGKAELINPLRIGNIFFLIISILLGIITIYFFWKGLEKTTRKKFLLLLFCLVVLLLVWMNNRSIDYRYRFNN